MSVYAGISPSTLSAWLSEAQTALHELVTGAQVVSLSRGDQRLAFTAADVDKLKRHIRDIQIALGIAGSSSRPAVARWTR